MSVLLDASTPTLPYDLYARRGRSIIQAFHKKLESGGITLPTISTFDAPASQTTDPVGILGAGPGGLYTALILDDLGIPYKILEAQGDVGGRLFTYTFPDKTGAPYNYFDIGAMRFPKIDSMKRVFNLFEYDKLNQDGIALNAKLQPFYFVGGGNNNTFFSYNGVTVKQNAVPEGDPFKARDIILDVANPDPYIKVGTKAIVDDVLDPFVIRLLEDLKTGKDDGWKYLQGFDMHSTRSYMSTVYIPSKKLTDLGIPKTHLPTDVVNWCEAFDKSTGWYDRALTETVLEAIAFGYIPESLEPRPTQWFCIDGGANQIAQCMFQYIKKRQPNAFTPNTRVTAISLSQDGKSMDVATANKNNPSFRFSHVISTIPLPVLRTLDLSGSKLTSMQANALRQLNYGPSVKIGLQFRTAWWTTASDKDGKPLNIVGGQTYTDRILRTVVYPSFGSVQAGKTTTLIASYCWTEDSERLAALIEKDPPRLIELVLRELSEIHNVTVKFLQDDLIDYKAFSWTGDVNTMGAFAFFGPGKFENVYQSLTAPAADGRLHFAGEAISVRHAWVEGALDSAWRAVNEMLLLSAEYAPYRQQFYQDWGYNPEWISGKANMSLPDKPPTRGGPRNRRQRLPAEPTIEMPEPEYDLVLQQMKHIHPEYF